MHLEARVEGRTGFCALVTFAGSWVQSSIGISYQYRNAQDEAELQHDPRLVAPCTTAMYASARTSAGPANRYDLRVAHRGCISELKIGGGYRNPESTMCCRGYL